MIAASMVNNDQLTKPLEPFREYDLPTINRPGVSGSFSLYMYAISEDRGVKLRITLGM